MPLPRNDVGSIPCSAASFRTAGESGALPLPPPAGAGCVAGPGASEAASLTEAAACCCFAGAGAAAAAGAPATSIWAITAPTCTVSPWAAVILTSLPSKGEGISALTLSVITSTSGSSRLTKSPSFFSHLSTVPSVTDSPSWGILIGATPMPRSSVRSGLKLLEATPRIELGMELLQSSALPLGYVAFGPRFYLRRGSRQTDPSLDPKQLRDVLAYLPAGAVRSGRPRDRGRSDRRCRPRRGRASCALAEVVLGPRLIGHLGLVHPEVMAYLVEDRPPHLFDQVLPALYGQLVRPLVERDP